jgi:hypothetical protein
MFRSRLRTCGRRRKGCDPLWHPTLIADNPATSALLIGDCTCRTRRLGSSTNPPDLKPTRAPPRSTSTGGPMTSTPGCASTTRLTGTRRGSTSRPRRRKQSALALLVLARPVHDGQPQWVRRASWISRVPQASHIRRRRRNMARRSCKVGLQRRVDREGRTHAISYA